MAFFLTTPYLGLMYYFVPKASNRPIYSYRLSIIHFWALIFIYIWAGPHHLLHTALPDWAQSLGTVFSIMLIAPSWGGMLNGLLTLRGAWDKVRKDPILKFMVVAVSAYGMATLEGPLLSLKNINAISHFTDWTIAHVHVGGLGWNGMLTFGMLYWLVPRMWQTKLHSERAANWHFWIATLGILFYALPLYWAGFTQAMMWKQFRPEGMLMHPNFLETVLQILPMYAMRVVGGTLYLLGAILMTWNLRQTMKAGTLLRNEEASAPALAPVQGRMQGERWHRWLERKPALLLVLSLLVILVGGIAEMVPTMLVESNIPTIEAVQPYTPLELEGRDLYIREGCNNCHSQMIRPFPDETERYGPYSRAGEFVYDHPFLWGSKRTGPDLQREGDRYPDSWQYYHMVDPQTMSPGSIMPRYGWLVEDVLDTESLSAKIAAMRTLGVPYPEGYELPEADGPSPAARDLQTQADAIVHRLAEDGITCASDREIVALIAYLQRLGTDFTSTLEP